MDSNGSSSSRAEEERRAERSRTCHSAVPFSKCLILSTFFTGNNRYTMAVERHRLWPDNNNTRANISSCTSCTSCTMMRLGRCYCEEAPVAVHHDSRSCRSNACRAHETHSGRGKHSRGVLERAPSMCVHASTAQIFLSSLVGAGHTDSHSEHRRPCVSKLPHNRICDERRHRNMCRSSSSSTSPTHILAMRCRMPVFVHGAEDRARLRRISMTRLVQVASSRARRVRRTTRVSLAAAHGPVFSHRTPKAEELVSQALA